MGFAFWEMCWRSLCSCFIRYPHFALFKLHPSFVVIPVFAFRFWLLVIDLHKSRWSSLRMIHLFKCSFTKIDFHVIFHSQNHFMWFSNGKYDSKFIFLQEVYDNEHEMNVVKDLKIWIVNYRFDIPCLSHIHETNWWIDIWEWYFCHPVLVILSISIIVNQLEEIQEYECLKEGGWTQQTESTEINEKWIFDRKRWKERI
jgi:hypothetical protein